MILSDHCETKPDHETKKSKSVVLYPLDIDVKNVDDLKVQITIQSESVSKTINLPRDLVISKSPDESTLVILKELDLDLEFYGFVFTMVSK